MKITIDNLRKDRKTLEEDILDLVHKFERIYGPTVASIDVTRLDVTSSLTKQGVWAVKVKVEV